MRRLVIGSRNAHKIEEIRAILAGLPIEVVSVSESPGLEDVVEDGTTFTANAKKKAWETANHLGEMVLADDSGLEVAALDGAPGVYSARYAGEPSNDERNNDKLLQELQGVPTDRRQARFRCVMVLVDPQAPEGSQEHIMEGSVGGAIAEARAGGNGFGYDPLFVVPEYGRTMAELGPNIKNQISHRARALAQVKNVLEKMVESS